ncbi:hypothetical protein M9H77_07833 [Catharanthus roseus]|uniref:Uncharacterized protein n=1 Tax=Catharanthus roseus TaxID=4058 RepID=A0ACC0BW33_CATRO|nr:hypothetical protein M9H77_07833 [Catharanthus roseus]
MLGRCTLDLNPVERECGTVGGLVRKGSPARVAQGSLGKLTKNTHARELTEHPSLMPFKCFLPFSDDSVTRSVPQGTQIPYPAAVDLAERYGVSHVLDELEGRMK